ncbi:DoxX family protein [Microbacterium sp. Root61]|uniref:DoxX family protein n=1 Tax=Microbacterium sp. Root61 TaxID=1736570 RepID=UPI0006FA3144|nr:DoxX family protein [Microbacterium sp. Root61]KRA24514.1 DoxX family protein [Microbacterium sp. Root61]
MLVAYWIAAGLLAAVTLFAALLKLFRSKAQLEESGMAWTADFAPSTIVLIGVLELVGVVGLIVPPLVGIAPILAPLAAVGLGILQIGASITHRRIGETPALNVALVVLAAIAAVTGFILWA